MANQQIEAVQLVSYSDQEGIVLNQEAVQKLRAVLEDPAHSERQLAVLSVAGPYRRGKSFLLNFIIKYLTAKNEGREDWLGSRNEPLKGFCWANGPDRNTVGIWVWPQLFPVSDMVSLLLLDTQGTFDVHSSTRESTAIFALSTVLSSMQVYNLHERIDLSDLTNLECFVSVSQLAQQMINQGKPQPQHFYFLIRDWRWPDCQPFGFQGGRNLLREALMGKEESRVVAKLLKNSFIDPVECFLMPYPGARVANEASFNGAVKDIEAAFIEHLETLLGRVLDPLHIPPKEQENRAMRPREFVTWCEITATAMRGSIDNFPENLCQAYQFNCENKVMEDAKRQYRRLMDGARESLQKKKLWTKTKVQEAHELAFSQVMEELSAKPFIGVDQAERMKRKDQIKKDVGRELQSIYHHYRQQAKDIVEKVKKHRRNGKSVLLGTTGAVTATGLVMSGVANIGAPAIPAAVAIGGVCLLAVGGTALVFFVANTWLLRSARVTKVYEKVGGAPSRVASKFRSIVPRRNANFVNINT